MKVLSLFDGISCARVALKRARIKVDVYYASEIDATAINVAQRNYEDTIQLGDITKIRGAGIGKIDLLIGGSPCQDLSIAKKGREGLSGSRSGLFYEYLRLLKETKPKYFILENVASMPKEARAEITKQLGVEPIMIDAQLVSAQRRKRLFWTNIPNIKQPKDREIYLKDIIEPVVDEKYYIKDETLKTIWEKMMANKPIGQALRVHGIEGKSVTLSALGGGSRAKTGLYVINPNGTEQTKSRTLRTKGMGSGFLDKHNWDQILVASLTEQRTDEAKKIRKENMKKGRDFSPRRAKELVLRSDHKANTLTTAITKEQLVFILQRGRGFNKGGLKFNKSPTLSKSAWQHNNHLFFGGRVRKLTPTECERLQSLKDGYTLGFSDNQRYKMLGNAFNAEVVAHILKYAK